MKRYIIKNADGSEQSEMQAIHESRKEAREELMEYINNHNEDFDGIVGALPPGRRPYDCRTLYV